MLCPLRVKSGHRIRSRSLPRPLVMLGRLHPANDWPLNLSPDQRPIQIIHSSIRAFLVLVPSRTMSGILRLLIISMVLRNLARIV